MGYSRGSRADYDAWEELGNPGWGWDGLLPYFRKSTTFTPPSPEVARRWNITWDPSVYGDGPLRTHISDFQYPDVAVFWDALREQPGLELPPGANAGDGPGAFWSPLSVDARTMTRSTARSAYYDPVNATRPNLRLVTGQTATEILFHPGKALKAKGVRIVSRSDNTTRSVYARKEVILAAGAIQTPQLLQASGIGPASVLAAAGVKVKKDLPSVGANLQDHPTTLLLFSLANQAFPNPDTITTNATYNATAWAEYLAHKTGPISTANGNTIAYYSLPSLHTNTTTTNPPSKATTLATALLTPKRHRPPPPFSTAPSPALSKASSPSAPSSPAPSPNPHSAITCPPAARERRRAAANPVDAANVVGIVRHARRFWGGAGAMARLGPVEIVPGVGEGGEQTDEELLDRLRADRGVFWPSLAHPCGTCAMIPEGLGGCVDAELRVYGVSGLRVVDASVMPLIVGSALQATVYAVAEKAADVIRGRVAAGP